MKTQITQQQFNESIERGKNVTITPAKPYVSKVEPLRKLDANKLAALQNSLNR